MVTFESDAERFTVFLGDCRAARWMAVEDGAWGDPGQLAWHFRYLQQMAMASANLGGPMVCCDTCPYWPTCEEIEDQERIDREADEWWSSRDGEEEEA